MYYLDDKEFDTKLLFKWINGDKTKSEDHVPHPILANNSNRGISLKSTANRYGVEHAHHPLNHHHLYLLFKRIFGIE